MLTLSGLKAEIKFNLSVKNQLRLLFKYFLHVNKLTTHLK